MSNKIFIAFHNASNYDYHFVTKELANEFEGQFELLWENIEKKNLVPIEKEVPKIDEDSNGSFETISSKRKRIDSARFVASSLSNLVDNFVEGIQKSKLKDCDCFLQYERAT